MDLRLYVPPVMLRSVLRGMPARSRKFARSDPRPLLPDRSPLTFKPQLLRAKLALAFGEAPSLMMLLTGGKMFCVAGLPGRASFFMLTLP